MICYDLDKGTMVNHDLARLTKSWQPFHGFEHWEALRVFYYVTRNENFSVSLAIKNFDWFEFLGQRKEEL